MKWSAFAERSAPVWKSQVSIESVPPYWGWWIYSCCKRSPLDRHGDPFMIYGAGAHRRPARSTNRRPEKAGRNTAKANAIRLGGLSRRWEDRPLSRVGGHLDLDGARVRAFGASCGQNKSRKRSPLRDRHGDPFMIYGAGAHRRPARSADRRPERDGRETA